jgi:hypothetical protein
MTHPTTTTAAQDQCASTGCRHPAAVILVAAHPTALACTTRRCHQCATRLACRYLHRGYAIHLTPASQNRLNPASTPAHPSA